MSLPTNSANDLMISCLASKVSPAKCSVSLLNICTWWVTGDDFHVREVTLNMHSSLASSNCCTSIHSCLTVVSLGALNNPVSSSLKQLYYVCSHCVCNFADVRQALECSNPILQFLLYYLKLFKNIVLIQGKRLKLINTFFVILCSMSSSAVAKSIILSLHIITLYWTSFNCVGM